MDSQLGAESRDHLPPIRKAPEVIRLLPPEGPMISARAQFWIQLLLWTFFVAGLLVSFWLLTVLFVGGVILLVMTLLFLIAIVVLTIHSIRIEKSYADLRKSAIKNTLRPTSPFIARRNEQLAKLWTRYSKPPSIEKLAEVLDRQPINCNSATIVVLGVVEIPTIGDEYFNPEIITPTDYFGRQLIFAPIAIAILFLVLLQMLGIIPTFVKNIGSFSYLLVIGIGAAFNWTRRTLVRPTYVRLAPGIIQILEFPFRSGKPTVREYPMISGTLAVVRVTLEQKIPRLVSLTLLRNGSHDELPLDQMTGKNRIIEFIWKALLSTAPTPPLPDDALTG